MNTQNSKHLLVVDDDTRVRETLVEALGALGYMTMQATNGQEALELIEKQRFDCIISDLQMPDIDGLTLIGVLKERIPDLPVVMITGFATAQHKVEAVEAGAAGFLMKPFRLSQIEDVLSRVFAIPIARPARPIHRVLIVDDDPEFRSLLSEVLLSMSYKPECAETAEEALIQIEQQTPDAMIVDFRLPEMSGETLVRTVKAMSPEMPVILMSGYAPSISGREYADGAADAFLMKPFRIDSVGTLLRSFENIPL